jgi:elongation factor P--(R)-beta-lysine ligase
MTDAPWRPTASLETLALRARLLAQVRAHFASEGVMEVETPTLARASVTDVHLASLATRVAGHGELFLQTSPEYAMKRLLAAGAPDIYQVARAYRDGERGAQHNPEFTLIEWYRRGFDLEALMRDCERLLDALLGSHRALGRPQYLTYREAMQRHAGIDPLQAPATALRACLAAHGVAPPRTAGDRQTDRDADDRDLWLDLLMSTVVGPNLGAGALTFLHDYPASQAALARLDPRDRRVARRFEIYLDGVELANGFHELADAGEQRARFERDLAERRGRGLPAVPLDERLLDALAAGLPDCSGVALGFDRVVMLAAGARRIDEVIAFPVERA